MASLSDLNDKQNMALTQLSYGSNFLSDYNGKTLEEVKNDLNKIDTSKIKNKDEEEEIKNLKRILNDKDNESLCSLRIKDVENDSKTGFGAVSFTDDSGNVGFSYRGTDGLKLKSLNDWLDNVRAMITGTSRQSEQALAFFNKNKDTQGNNFLFGHSKGGELAEYVYVRNYALIRAMHTLNAQPINQYSLNPEQLKSLKDEKVDMVVNNGDVVWMTGLVPPYKIRFAKTKGGDSHAYKNTVYENGKLVIATQEDFKSNPNWKIGLFFASQNILGSMQASYFRIEYTKACVLAISHYANNNMQSKIDSFIEMASKQLKRAGSEYDVFADELKPYLVAVAGVAMAGYNKDFGNVKQYTEPSPQITVDTYKLRIYAQRLQAVNRRISTLNNSLNLLYWKSGLLDLWQLRKRNTLQFYASRLTQCTSYLNDTAADFEAAESNITNNL